MNLLFLIGAFLYAATLHNPRPITEELIEAVIEQWREETTTVVNTMELYQTIDKPIVSFLGGHKVKKSDPYYRAAYRLSKKLAQAGCLIVCGGGTGIMEAANCGAASVKDQNITSIAIDMQRFGPVNSCAQKRIVLETYFARKWLLLEQASALVFFPGGVGTLDELVSILTLIDSNIDKRMPIYVIGKEQWREIQMWISQGLELGLITKETATLTVFTDSIKEAEVGILEWIASHIPVPLQTPPKD